MSQIVDLKYSILWKIVHWFYFPSNLDPNKELRLFFKTSQLLISELNEGHASLYTINLTSTHPYFKLYQITSPFIIELNNILYQKLENIHPFNGFIRFEEQDKNVKVHKVNIDGSIELLTSLKSIPDFDETTIPIASKLDFACPIPFPSVDIKQFYDISKSLDNEHIILIIKPNPTFFNIAFKQHKDLLLTYKIDPSLSKCKSLSFEFRKEIDLNEFQKALKFFLAMEQNVVFIQINKPNAPLFLTNYIVDQTTQNLIFIDIYIAREIENSD